MKTQLSACSECAVYNLKVSSCSGLRSAQDQGKHKSGENSNSLCCQILRTTSVQYSLALLPDPEGVELPDNGVVESELSVVGKVVGSLPLGNNGVLEGGVLVGQAAAPERVTVNWLNLGNV